MVRPPRTRFPLRPALALAAAALVLGCTHGAEAGLVTIGAGRSGFRDSRVAAQFAVIYQHDPFAAHIRPVAGFLGSTGGDALLFAGLGTDVPLVAGFGLTPILSSGYYSEGSGSRLGGAVEFRSTLEIWHRLGRSSRIGFSVDHISNAGLFHHNPGRESLFLTLTSLR